MEVELGADTGGIYTVLAAVWLLGQKYGMLMACPKGLPRRGCRGGGCGFGSASDMAVIVVISANVWPGLLQGAVAVVGVGRRSPVAGIVGLGVRALPHGSTGWRLGLGGAALLGVVGAG